MPPSRADARELRGTLHRKGLRMTPQRQLVLDALTSLGHATPEAIHEQVQLTAPAVNASTVYRTLDLLESIGLVRHAHLGHGPATYSVDPHEHVHLACHGCGEVVEVDPAELGDLAQRLLERHGFTLDPTHLALSGRCARCAGEDD